MNGTSGLGKFTLPLELHRRVAWVAQWLEALTGNHRIKSSNHTGAKD